MITDNPVSVTNKKFRLFLKAHVFAHHPYESMALCKQNAGSGNTGYLVAVNFNNLDLDIR